MGVPGHSPRYVITLVHGTMPRIGPVRLFSRSDWVEEGSLARNQILAALGEEVSFSSFKWSGDNSHRARIRAAADLANLLQNQISNNRSAAHFIIAHSHGGNVSLYALNQLDAAARAHINGLVTLGTPFVQAATRDVEFSRGVVSNFVTKGTLAWSVAAAGALMLRSIEGAEIPTLLWAIPLSVSILGLMSCFFLWRWPVERWLNQASILEQRLCAMPTEGLLMLCVSARRDEARLLLRLMDWLASKANWQLEVVSPLLGIWDSFGQFVGEHRMLYEVFKFGLHQVPGLGVFFLPFVFAFFAFAGLSLFFMWFVVLVSLLTIAAPWGFGGGILLPWVVKLWIDDSPMVERSRPQEASPILSLQLSDNFVYDKRKDVGITRSERIYSRVSFQHSFLHEDAEVLRVCVDWLRQVRR